MSFYSKELQTEIAMGQTKNECSTMPIRTVPFISRRFDKAGIHPRDIETL